MTDPSSSRFVDAYEHVTRGTCTLVLFALMACKEPRRPDITGTLVIDGTDVSAETVCRPGAAVHIFVDIVTPRGTLRFEDGKLFLGGEPLPCTKLDRSWGGGRRPNNQAYWRGTLAFECGGEAGLAVRGDLDLDCGNITAEERKQLDAKRTELREQQTGSAKN